MVIKYENTDFRIFLTDDTLTCYVCHQTGHTSSFCKKNKNNNHDSSGCTLTPTRVGDNVIPNILSSTQMIILTCEKVNENQVNSTQETNLICEIVNDTQNFNTNFKKPINPNNNTSIPNEPIKRPPPSPTNTSAPSVTPHHINQQINENPDQPKTIRDKLLNSNQTKSKSVDPSKKN
jgi:hypothetical protein